MAVHKGSCHCGEIVFEIEAELSSGIVCDCSLCKRKNAIMISIPKENFTLVKGADALTLYRWNTGVARHYFCKHCGIYTHHQRRTRPELMGVNAGCIDGIDARALPVEKVEGAKLSGAPPGR
jgi:hypothetical protein